MARPGIKPWVSLIPEGHAKPLHYRALVGEESPTPTVPTSQTTWTVFVGLFTLNACADSKEFKHTIPYTANFSHCISTAPLVLVI